MTSFQAWPPISDHVPNAINRASLVDSKDTLLAFVASFARAVPDLLRQDRRPPETVAGCSWATLDANLAQTRSRPNWACAPGCAACCHETVPVLFPEGWLIAKTLERSNTPEALAALKPLLAHRAGTASSCSSPQEYLLQRLPCAFLEAGLCSIHRARPLACRSHHSMDRSACERRLEQDPRQSLPYDILASAIGGGVISGLQQGCTAQGLDARLFELHSLVLWCLDHPRAASTWLDGERLPVPPYVDAVPTT